MGLKVKKAEIEAFLKAHEHIEDPHLFDVGKRIGDWRLTAFIGRGGSGEVYRAQHTELAVTAAIKILSRDDKPAKDRFRREAQILAENVLPVFPRFYGFGKIEGRSYIVLELLEYLPLPTTDKEVARYLLNVCVGVDRLHSLGLVHRDIKPQNVLQRESSGQPVLIDLGLVKDVTLPVAHRGESLSIVNGKAVGVGTPRYAAPEQFSGGDISPSADIHALGMLANECFGGNPPRSWTRIIRRSTSSIPSQRYANIAQFARAVKYRHLVRWVVFGLLVAALVCGSVGAWFFKVRLPDLPSKTATALSPVITMMHQDVVATNVVPMVSNAQNQVVRQPQPAIETTKRINDAVVSKGSVGGRAQNDTAGEDSGLKLVEQKDLKIVDAPTALPKAEKPNGKKVKKWPQQGSFSGDKNVGQDFW